MGGRIGPDIFRWGGGLPRERVGAKKFGMSLEIQGNQTLGRDILPGKFEKKKVCVQFSSSKGTSAAKGKITAKAERRRAHDANIFLMVTLKTGGAMTATTPQNGGSQLRCSKSAMCIAATCIAAVSPGECQPPLPPVLTWGS